MSLSLKAKPNGKLRTFHVWPTLGPPLERYPLSAECDCCQTFPDSVPATYRVDLCEKTTVTASGKAHYFAHFYEHGVGGNLGIWPYVEAHGGGVWSFTATLIGPGEIPTPSGFDDNGGGENANWLVQIDWTFGESGGTEYFEKGATEPAEREVTWSASFSARLFAANREVSRFNTNLTLWGPRPRVDHPEDAWDVRGYKTSDIRWHYWSPDGAGTLTVKAWGEEMTKHGSGIPIAVGAGDASMNRANAGTGSGDESYLEASFFGNHHAPSDSGTLYADPPSNTDGATAWTSGSGRISAQQAGASSTFRRIRLSIENMQPDRELTFTMLPVDAEGSAYADDTFEIEPYDGPDWTQPVNTEYPVGTALDLKAPGSQTLTGVAYKVGVSGYVGAGGGTLEPLSLDVDTIGDPAFGFVYSGASLENSGQKRDAWRCGFRLPGACATWDSIEITPRGDYYLETFDSGTSGWSAGAGTTVSNSGGKLHLSGAGTLSASKSYGIASGIGGLRYLRMRVQTASGSSTFSVKCTGRQWDFTPSSSGSTITVDTIAPTDASGMASVTTKQQARDGTTDWAWGIEPGETIEISCSEECWVDWIQADGRGEDSFAVVGEAIYQNEPEFFEKTVTEDSETLDLYLHRQLLFVQEGRIVYDEECGRVADGTILYNGQKVHDVRNIQYLLELANTRAGTTGLTRLKSLKPPAGGLTAGWGGRWPYFKPEHYFTNQAESYMLRPGVFYGAQGQTMTLKADYVVDRFAPGVGVSYEFVHRKLVGGGFHGVALDAGAEPVSATVGTSENSDSTTAENNGVWILPDSEIVDVETPEDYTFVSGFEGSPHSSTLHGVSRRIGLKKSS